jgi:carbamoyl-phosphate synthase large subunit
MNILLTSVGRRSYLVKYFKQALAGRGQVICANMYADTAAMYVADQSVVVPASHDSRYIPKFLELCRDYQIKLVSSFHDLDLYILSQHQDEIRQAGAFPMLPSAEWGRIALDKQECHQYLSQHGFNLPWTTSDLSEALTALAQGWLKFPVIVKARMGFGSLGLQRCHSLEALQAAYALAKEHVCGLHVGDQALLQPDESILIQQSIQGREFRINVINDLSGQYVCHFICEVHAMRAGETDRATTVESSLAGDLPMRLSALTRHPGIWGVDCMDDNGVLRIIDINPRFAGEYPFFHLAGADIPRAIMAWLSGIKPKPSWLKIKTGVHGIKDIGILRAEKAITYYSR